MDNGHVVVTHWLDMWWWLIDWICGGDSLIGYVVVTHRWICGGDSYVGYLTMTYWLNMYVVADWENVFAHWFGVVVNHWLDVWPWLIICICGSGSLVGYVIGYVVARFKRLLQLIGNTSYCWNHGQGFESAQSDFTDDSQGSRCNAVQ